VKVLKWLRKKRGVGGKGNAIFERWLYFEGSRVHWTADRV